MRSLKRLFLFGMLLVLLAGVLQPLPGLAAARPAFHSSSAPGSPAPRVTYDSQHDQSLPLSQVALQAGNPSGAAGQPRLIANHPLPKALLPTAKPAADGALRPQLPDAAPSPLASFDGLGNLSGVMPPDTQGDIGFDSTTGTRYYVQWINSVFAVWNVTDILHPSMILGPANGNSLWSGFGGACQNTNDGDPITLFDPISKRWLMSQFALPSYPYGPFYQCIAISTSANPTGSYYRYAFKWTNGAGLDVMNDYPKFGVWPDGYYMMVHQFSAGAGNWAGTGVASFERSAMLSGNPARLVSFDMYPVDQSIGGVLPSDIDGNVLPPAGAPNIFAMPRWTGWSDPIDGLELFAFHVDWTNTNNSTFTSLGIKPVAAWTLGLCSTYANPAECVPQKDSSQKVDAISDRLMHRLAYRNLGDHQALVTNLTVDAGSGRAGVRWMELRDSGSDWSIYQEQTIAPPGSDYRWMGSVAQDHDGNLAVGYSVSGVNTYPSVRYTGRLATDPPSTTLQEASLVEGKASQAGGERWGDYSMMSIDPGDDCTFWYTQEYVSAPGSWNWNTRIGAFRFPTCNLASGQLSGQITSGGAALPGALIQASLSPTYTQSTTSGADGHYNLALLPGTYTVTASEFGYGSASAANVPVSAFNTTVQDFSLTRLPRYTLTGRVADATTGWPLYANIAISGVPGTPVTPTDMATGTYSITLPGNLPYDLTVTPLFPGYQAGKFFISSLTSDLVQDFNLNADLAACTTPGYHLVYDWGQNFDSAAPASLPSGWDSMPVNTTGSVTPAWFTNAGSHTPPDRPAHSQPNLVYFNANDAYTDSSARLYTLSGLDMSGFTNATLSFWMYHDTDQSSAEQVQVQVSTNSGVTWTDVGAPFVRYDGSSAWKRHTLDLSAYASQTDLRLGFLGASDYGSDIHLDDIGIGPHCQAYATGGLVVGHVYDQNTGQPLVGASVSTGGGLTTTLSMNNPSDPAQGQGFFSLFDSTEGFQTFNASMAFPHYSPSDLQVRVFGHDAKYQDFSLPAGRLSNVTHSIEVTVAYSDSIQAPLVISNTGSAPLNILTALRPFYLDPQTPQFNYRSLTEIDPASLLPMPGAKAARRLLTPPSARPQAAGDVLSSFPTGLADNRGVAYDPPDHSLWVVSSCAGSGGDCKTVEYKPDGTPTGRFYTYPWTPNTGPSGLTYNANTGMLWMVDIGEDNCLHELDPDNGWTGDKLCISGPDWEPVSMFAVAYNPADDSYFVGRDAYAGCPPDQCQSVIQVQGETGAVPGSVMAIYPNLGVDITGLAYNPSSKVLYAADGTASLHVFDASGVITSALMSTLNLSTGSAWDLAVACDGGLAVSDLDARMIRTVDSGWAGSACPPALDWITTAPVTTTLPIQGQLPLGLYFNSAAASITHPGDYQAILRLKNNSPYTSPEVLLTMHVIFYGLQLAPQSDGQSGAPNSRVHYTLHITNTAGLTDTFDILPGGNAWQVNAPASVTVGPHQGVDVSVEVVIPLDAYDTSTDEVTLVFTSVHNANVSAQATLTTRSVWYKLYLPVATRP